MNNNEERMNYSPENKKINYYEQNPKLFKRQRQRTSLDVNPILNNENLNNNTNIRLDFDDNIKFNQGLLDIQNNFCISQPSNNNNFHNNNFCAINILDDLINELESEEKEKNMNYNKNKDQPMGSELKRLFERNKYSSFFQTSRTQNPQFPNIWDDFHQKRDKL